MAPLKLAKHTGALGALALLALLGACQRQASHERPPNDAREAALVWTGTKSELSGPDGARELRLRQRRASLKVLGPDLAPVGLVRELGPELWLDAPNGQRRLLIAPAQAPDGRDALGVFVAVPQDKPRDLGPDQAHKAPDAPDAPAPLPSAPSPKGEALAWLVPQAPSQEGPRLQLLSKNGEPWLDLSEEESGWVAKDRRAGVAWLLKRQGRGVAAWSGAQAEPQKRLDGGRWEPGACAPALIDGWDALAPGLGPLLQAGVMLAFERALRPQAR